MNLWAYLTGSFEVIHPSPDRLVVVAPPQGFLVLVVVAIVVIALWSARSALRRSRSARIWSAILVLIGGTIVLSLVTTHGTAVFDKSKGTVTFDRVGLLFRREHKDLPLDEVRLATVHQANTSYQFVVVFSDDSEESLQWLVSSSGQYAAARAVNRFLGR